MAEFNNEQLVSIVERIERLNEEVDHINEGIKEVYEEAKSAGFDPKYIRKIIALRKLDRDELNEQDELIEMYRNAVGL